MRTTAGIFFLGLYLIAMLRPVEPLIEYYLRYEYFSKKLCINLNRPELKCNGTCALMERLRRASEESGLPGLPATAGTISMKDYPVGFVVLLPVFTSPTDYSEPSCVPYDIVCLLSGFVTLPDHPPQVSV